MHLFRSVFILATATLALVANVAIQASAFPFGILPLTRYMLDAVPEGAGGPAAAEAATIQGGGPLVDVPNAASSSIDVDAVPLAVETSAVEDHTEETPISTVPVDIAQESSVSSDASTPSAPAVATESTSVASIEPSAVIPENVLAKANSAERIIGLGGPLLITSVVSTVLFVL
ncbi:hypothetical protein ONZ51_g10634 [Trametes cubensis]|uniref:Uncharacterized protein n=1 Tax=Trametes cubensis TaxID=1111947 RepID=A0AAD7X8N6_9APHY|nr:hypothetical protein ONZ51_g10634 [Trametes cubensis]